MAASKKTALKRNDFLSMLFMLSTAFVVSYIPILHWPLSWMQTFFHEISHGLAAVITGGWILQIELNLNGSGLCTSANGIRFFTSFAGYLGAVIWGMLIYIMVDNASPKSADRIAKVILGLIALTVLLWARDIITWLILGFIAVPFVIILRTKELLVEQFFMRLAGLYILLDAIKSPLYLLSSETGGDAAIMQSLTYIPQFIWVFIWFGCGILALGFLIIRHSWLAKRQAVQISDYRAGNSTEDVLERTKLLLKKIKQNKN